jgi:hypothetical protein
MFQNYIPELTREDIPQALRGQRNVIFGNIEKIYEFHSQHFLGENRIYVLFAHKYMKVHRTMII